MADKKLESITFPDLPDRYVVKPDIADVTGLQTALDDKANIDGTYDNMTVGNAKQLLSNVFTEDTEPYLFRTAGGSIDIGDRLGLKLVGGTVAWNQLFNPQTKVSDGITITNNNDGSVTLSGTPSVSGNAWVSLTNTAKTIVGHKYYIDKGSDSDLYNLSNDSGGVRTVTTRRAIGSATKEAFHYVYVPHDNTLSNIKATIQIIDLTALFGSTIADYIYSLEQATAGSGVAFFKKLFPKPYYEYNAGELMSVQTSGHITTGFNQWDEEWESGYINSDGSMASNASSIRSKNLCPCVPNTAYYFRKPSTYAQTPNICWYDANKAFISRSASTPFPLITSPNNAHYFKISCYNYGATYNHDICINLHWDGERDGEYEEYSKHEYPLADIKLRGIPKLDASNNLYYDGDTYESDGTVNRRYEERAYQSGDESLADAITDGTKTVVKKATPTTETADPYTDPQTVDNWGTEEFIDTREVPMPVGHISKYPLDLRSKLESLANPPSSDGEYVLKQTSGEDTYVSLAGSSTIASLVARIEALENAE